MTYFPRNLSLLCLLLFAGCASPRLQQRGEAEIGKPLEKSKAPVEIQISTTKILRSHADGFPGINLNYLRDSDANRPSARPLKTALRDLGVRWLRYPGGEKSDFYFWSPPPHGKSSPVVLGDYRYAAGARMGFDEFVKLCRSTGAEPLVVVGYDSVKRSGITRKEWIEHARAFVRYANVEKKYGIRYWEIGNENWNHRTAKPKEMAEIVAEFANAMKEVDPGILVGSGGSDLRWWKRFLPEAASHLDFLTLSLYPTYGWQGYREELLESGEIPRSRIREVLHAWRMHAPDSGPASPRLIVTETNAINWHRTGWGNGNSLGRALVSFETIGALLEEPAVSSAMLWGTRWLDDKEAKSNVFFGLGPSNEILPAGRALALWSQFLRPELVTTKGGTSSLITYASRTKNHSELVVWILNRGLEPVENISLQIQSPVRYARATVFRFSGKNPEDPAPFWKRVGRVSVNRRMLEEVSVPPLSVTIWVFQQ